MYWRKDIKRVSFKEGGMRRKLTSFQENKKKTSFQTDRYDGIKLRNTRNKTQKHVQYHHWRRVGDILFHSFFVVFISRKTWYPRVNIAIGPRIEQIVGNFLFVCAYVPIYVWPVSFKFIQLKDPIQLITSSHSFCSLFLFLLQNIFYCQKKKEPSLSDR